MEMRNNRKIRSALTDTGMKYWELAKLLKISDGTLCRRLREEMPDKEQDRIVDLIRKEMISNEKCTNKNSNGRT